MEKSEAYRIVFEDLTAHDWLGTGVYDARHGKEEFMHGVSTVMECIAANVSNEVYEAFEKRFYNNMMASQEKAEQSAYNRGYADAVQGIADELVRQGKHIASNEVQTDCQWK